MSSLHESREGARAAAIALTHEVRRNFLHALLAMDGPLTPPDHAAAKGLPVSLVSYHAGVLAMHGVIEPDGPVQRGRTFTTSYRLDGRNCARALAMLPRIERLAARDTSYSPHRPSRWR